MKLIFGKSGFKRADCVLCESIQKGYVKTYAFRFVVCKRQQLFEGVTDFNKLGKNPSYRADQSDMVNRGNPVRDTRSPPPRLGSVNLRS